MRPQRAPTRNREAAADAWLRDHDIAATTHEVAKALDVTDATMRRSLKVLEARGLVERLGTGRATVWVTA